ncbi:hypothetical protein [Vreelandella utahensis]|uniref:hypothetical protein n=1 Tax=Vreelandella halophila TaxID=86177 RepID=UPI0009879327|nr:hypothetical protein [Halomonas utahensis]
MRFVFGVLVVTGLSVPTVVGAIEDAVCGQVKALSERGELKESLIELGEPVGTYNPAMRLARSPGAIYEIDVNGDGNSERLVALRGRGSCSGTFYTSEAALNTVINNATREEREIAYPLSHLVNDDTRWDFWGTDDHFIRISGALYAVTGAFHEEPPVPRRVDMVSTDGRRNVCRFDAPTEIKITYSGGSDAGVCGDILNGNATEVKPSKNVNVDRDALRKRAASPLAAGKQLDLDGDGAMETIAWLNYASTAGCGNDWQTIVELEPDRGILADTQLSAALKENMYNISDTAGEPWDRVRVFERGDSHYILAHGRSADGETARGVFQWDQGGFRRVCKIQLLPQY